VEDLLRRTTCGTQAFRREAIAVTTDDEAQAPNEIHVHHSQKDADIPDYDAHVRCRLHPRYMPNSGFGLAGGGYGPYTYCSICMRILSKSSIEE
jgi:hypothetical protein